MVDFGECLVGRQRAPHRHHQLATHRAGAASTAGDGQLAPPRARHLDERAGVRIHPLFAHHHGAAAVVDAGAGASAGRGVDGGEEGGGELVVVLHCRAATAAADSSDSTGVQRRHKRLKGINAIGPPRGGAGGSGVSGVVVERDGGAA